MSEKLNPTADFPENNKTLHIRIQDTSHRSEENSQLYIFKSVEKNKNKWIKQPTYKFRKGHQTKQKYKERVNEDKSRNWRE